MCFSHFTVLKHLCYTKNLSISTINAEFLANLLISATAPMLLQLIHIDLYIYWWPSCKTSACLALSNQWRYLDNALNTRNFINLTTITCNVRLFLCIVNHAPNTTDYTSEPRAQQIDPRPLLPYTSSSSSIKLDLQLMLMSQTHNVSYLSCKLLLSVLNQNMQAQKTNYLVFVIVEEQ